MIFFWLVAALLVAAVLGVLLRPLLRQQPAGPGAAEPVAALYRRQLAEIDIERAQGRLDAEQAEAARAEITRRMLAAVEAEARPAAAAAGRTATWRNGAAVAIASLLPAAALAIYLGVGMPAAIDGAPNLAGGEAEQLASAAARLRQHLERDPGDVAGWALLGRTMAALGRPPEAQDAFRHAIALAPGDPELHAQLGEILVLAARGRVTPEATAEFAKAPKDPRARFYDAQAKIQNGDVPAAKAELEALLADSPAEAPWRQAVAARLDEIGREARPGPSPQDAANAATMAPEARSAMIAGMVAKLEARLAADPNDATGWLMLARSYRVLGRDADAAAALKRATAKIPGNLELLKAYLDTLAAGLTDERLPAELVAVAARINAADAEEPAALWYLGLAAAQRGDKPAAAGYWRRLLAELPAEDDKRAVVQQHLDALR